MSDPRQIVVATSNPGKLREIRQTLAGLDVQVVGLEAVGPIPAPCESGATFAENARDKAMYYARATGRWCLADDSGLAVDALGGAPGVHSARFAADACGPDAPRSAIDAANNRRLLAELDGVPEPKRAARFVCHLALAGPEGILLEASDTVEGRIGLSPAGENGFGYDPLFVMPELAHTAAELSAEQKNRISHRGKAVRRFAQRLHELLDRRD